MVNVSRRKSLLRKVARILGLVIIIICIVRVCFWHVENDIREAAYRYAFNHLYHNQSTWKASFIGICYGCSSFDQPSIPALMTPFLLDRFRGCKPPVKPESECCYSDRKHQIVDKKTGKTGVIFYTGAIKWVSWNTVKVEVGYYEGTLSSSGNIYTIKRKNGRWVVVKDKMLLIS